MEIECFDHKGQIFTHIDRATKEQTIFAVTEIRRHCYRNFEPLFRIPLIRRDAKMIKRYRGIETHRLARAMAAEEWLPLLFAHMPDGTDLLIDGSHTYVARTMLGHRWALAHLVPQEVWCYYTVDGLPQATEEELANSWSGIT
jgi:hypothetical protein